MPWQKIVRHINDQRIIVENKSGDTYPAEPEFGHLGESVYSRLHDDADSQIEHWAWVDFSGGTPIIEDVLRKSDGPPDSPPWDR